LEGRRRKNRWRSRVWRGSLGRRGMPAVDGGHGGVSGAHAGRKTEEGRGRPRERKRMREREGIAVVLSPHRGRAVAFISSPDRRQEQRQAAAWLPEEDDGGKRLGRASAGY
jgi:hypothetical protein